MHDDREDAYVAKHRPLLWAVVAFSVGIVLARILDMPFVHMVAGAAAFAAISCVHVRPLLRNLALAALIFSAGAADYSWHATSRSDYSSITQIVDQPVLCYLTGRVDGETTTASTEPLVKTPTQEHLLNSTFRISAESIETNGCVITTTGDVRVSLSGAASGVQHGDRVRVFGRLSLFNKQRDRYAASSGFVARMTADSPECVQIIEAGGGSFLRSLYALKDSLRREIDDCTTLSYFSAATPVLLKAMLLGDRGELEPDLRASFNKSGTTHIIAISGLHVAIVYAGIFWLCRLMLAPAWVRRIIVFIVIISYGIITGLGPATIRAVIMILAFELADWLKYYREPLNVLAFSALAILIFAPQDLYNAGFQLTFVAVAGLILFTPHISSWLRRRPPDDLERLADRWYKSRWKRIRDYTYAATVSALGVSAAATLAVAPLQAYYFQVFTPISILATAILVPVTSLLIALGFVFFPVASVFPAGANAVGFAISFLSMVFERVAEFAASLPLGHEFIPPPSVAWVFVFYASLVVVAARKRFRLSAAVAACVPVAVVSSFLLMLVLRAPSHEFTVHFVNVGHGTSAVITCAGRTVVYDCGSGTPLSAYDVGQAVVAPYLWDLGVKRIDLLILSHTDVDHINGVRALAERFKIGEALVHETFRDDDNGRFALEALQQKRVPVREVSQGDRVTLPGVEMEVVWPPRNIPKWPVNERSLVVKVQSGKNSVLLTGDVMRIGAGTIIGQNPQLHADVLLVPHHGLPEPVLEEFIRHISPQFAIISGDERKASDLRAVKTFFPGIRLYDTFRTGTIKLTATNAGWKKSE